MRKPLLKIALLLISVCVTNVSAQTDDFYSSQFLKSDFTQVNAVVHINVTKRKLAHKIGSGDCEQSRGTGYCFYLLKAEVKEVFKGKIDRENLEFYTTTEMDFSNKDSLLGEKIVFLNRSDHYPNRKMSFGTLENSTRENKYGIIEKLRKIAKINKKPVPKKVPKAAR